jgi:tape measure domain-containing protein
MPDISTMVAKLTVSAGGFKAGMNNAVKDLDGFKGKVDSVGSSFAGFAVRMAGLGAGLVGGIGLGTGIKLAAEFEQTTVAMTTMLKSGEMAKSLLADLTSFAASTPFEFPEIAAAAKQLLAYGSSASEILPQIRMLGDVAAGVSQPIGDIAYLFGTVRTQGKAMTVDINQFAGRGIPIYAALAKTLGTTTAGVRKLAEEGQISFDTINGAFQEMTKSGGQFYGMMAAQSNTVAGLFSTLKDNVGMALRQIGDTFIKEFNVKDGMKGLIETVGEFGSRVVGVTAVVAKWATANGEVILGLGKQAVVIGGSIYAIKTLVEWGYKIAQAYRLIAQSQVVMLALSGPKGWVTLAAGIAAAGVALYAVNGALDAAARAADKATASIKAVGEETKKAAASSQIEQQAFENMTGERLKLLERYKQAIKEGKREWADELESQIRGNQNNEVERLQRMAAAQEKANKVTAASVLSAAGVEAVAKAQQEQAAAHYAAKKAAEDNNAEIKKTVEGYRQEAEYVGLSAETIELHKLALKGATYEQLQAARSALQYKVAMEQVAKQSQAVKDIIAGLAERASTPNYTGTQLELWKLAKLGATDAEMAHARALAKTADEMENQKRLMEDMEQVGKSIAESILTPWERLGEELKKLAKVEASGMLHHDLALRSAKKALIDALGGAKGGSSRVDAMEMRFTAGFRQEPKQDLQQVIADLLKNGNKLTKEMKDYLKALAERPDLTASLGA